MRAYIMRIQQTDQGPQMAVPRDELREEGDSPGELACMGSLKKAVAKAIEVCRKNGWWAFTLHCDSSAKPSYADHAPFGEFKTAPRPKKAEPPLLPEEFLPTGGPAQVE